MSVQPAVEFEHIGKRYTAGVFGTHTIVALDDVSLRVETGEVVGLVGPNRAGKTTLVKILLSICHPSSGRFWRLGRLGSARETLAEVGYMHEQQAFPRYLTARGLLDYYAALGGVPRTVARQRAEELLVRVGLADRSHEPIGRFSKGMVQRLALAQSLINDPALLVLDEPAEGMDITARQLMHEVIRERRSQGKTVLLVSHSLADVQQLCDRVAVMRGAKLAFCGTLNELLAGSADRSPAQLERALEPIYLHGGPSDAAPAVLAS